MTAINTILKRLRVRPANDLSPLEVDDLLYREFIDEMIEHPTCRESGTFFFDKEQRPLLRGIGIYTSNWDTRTDALFRITAADLHAVIVGDLSGRAREAIQPNAEQVRPTPSAA